MSGYSCGDCVSDFVTELTKKDERIFICVRVLDSSKAQKLLSTFCDYQPENKEYFGVEVESFTDYDEIKNIKNALSEIKKLNIATEQILKRFNV